jgi:ribosomal protein L21
MKKILVLYKNNQYVLNEGDIFVMPYNKYLEKCNFILFKKIMFMECEENFIRGNPFLNFYEFQVYGKVLNSKKYKVEILKKNRRKHYRKKVTSKNKSIFVNLLLIKKI